MFKVTKVQEVHIPADAVFGEDSLLRGDIGDQPNQPSRGAHLFINTKMQYQTIRGIGGAFSELGGKALLSLPETERETVANALFHNKLKFFRMPVGASDFGLDAYSMNDTEDDFEMEHFSLARDKEYVIPYIALCKAHCEDMALFLSPWSPPWWMKETKKMGNGGAFIDEERYYKAYAKYVRLAIEGLEQEGFPVERYLIQNEPDVNPDYPSCEMPMRQMGTIVHYIREELRAHGINSEVWAGTFRSINGSTGIDYVTENSDRIDEIDGIGLQYTIMQQVHDLYTACPNLGLMHTESACFHGENSWEQAILLYLAMIDYYSAGCDTFTYWNMILNQESKSTWGWQQNSLIRIDEISHEVTYNPDYDIMSLAARCFTKGAKRIAYTSMNKRGIAVQKTDGSIVMLTSNFSDKREEGEVTVDGVAYPITLEPLSIACFELQKV